MQPVMRRRRAAWRTFHTEFGWSADPGRDWQCQSGGSNENDPLCPPARPDLGAPVIQSCGYQNQDRRAVFAAVMAENGVSVGGSGSGAWPPGPAPTDIGHPWQPPPPPQHGGSMGTPLECPNWYEHWDYQAQACVEDPHENCEGYSPERTWSWEVEDCVPWPCSGPGVSTPEPMAWSWDAMGCVPAAGADAAPGTTPLLALSLGDVGDYAERRSQMSYHNQPAQFFGTATPRRRRMARELAAGADARHGFAVGFGHSSNAADTAHPANPSNPSGITGTMLPGGQGWVRTSPIAQGMSVGMDFAPPYSGYTGVTGASAKSARSVRRYNLMARSRAGMSVGMHGDAAHVNGVFYGTQNPLREATRRRQHPSGFQHGFAVGRGCGY